MFIIEKKKDGSLWYRRTAQDRPILVCSVREAAGFLKKSTRQIYRYIESGILDTVDKAFGEIILDFNQVKMLQKNPLWVQPLPTFLQPLFPEYDLSTLNAGKDRNLIICRILDQGNLNHIRWMFKRYGRKNVGQAFQQDGHRLLSSRSLKLWQLFLKIKPKKTWRIKYKNPWLKKAS